MRKTKFTLSFDEFFKTQCQNFFAWHDYQVLTEFEIFHLPKRADVLVIQSQQKKPPPQFQIFDYWKTHNIISFKSLADPVRLKDIDETIIYLLGYLGMQSTHKKPKHAQHENTTATLICAKRPSKRFLNEIQPQLAPGKFRLDFRHFSIHIIDLSAIPPNGPDAHFLLTHAPTERLKELANQLTKDREGLEDPDKKNIDKLLQMLLFRIKSFENDEIKEQIMPVRLKADITELVKPHYDQGWEEGCLVGEKRGEKIGEKIGEKKGEKKGEKRGFLTANLQGAKKMLEKDYPLDEILEITGLAEEDLIQAGLLPENGA